jgi:hypothetical protein
MKFLFKLGKNQSKSLKCYGKCKEESLCHEDVFLNDVNSFLKGHN